MEKIRIYANDSLSKYDDGSFVYTDSYGDSIDFMSFLYAGCDPETVANWMIEEGIEITEEIANFLGIEIEEWT